MRKRTIAALALFAAVSIPAMARAQDTTHVPKGKTVVHNAGEETERVGKRTGKAVTKGAKDTGKQVKRTGKSLKKVVSRKARKEDAAKKP